jgi:hypothetical protein
MAVYQKDLPALTQGANDIAQLILGNQSRLQQQRQQSGLDVKKAQAMLPVEQQKAQQQADIDLSKEQKIGDAGQQRALGLKDLLGAKAPGHKYNISVGGNGSIGISEAEQNPLPAMMRHDQQIQQQAQGYSKRLENVNGFNSALQEIEAKTNRDGKGGVLSNPDAKTLSVGGMKSAIPESMTGIAEMVGALPAGATDERKAFQRLANEYMKATSGMRVTPEAAAREKAAMGNVISNDSQLAAKGARALALMMKERLGAIQGGYTPEARAQVHTMSGDPAAFYSNVYDDNAQGAQKQGGGGVDLRCSRPARACP